MRAGAQPLSSAGRSIVKLIAAEAVPAPSLAVGTPEAGPVRSVASGEAVPGSFWLERLFWLAEHAPGVLRLIRGPLARLAVRSSGAIRTGTLANAARILGSNSTPAERRAFARRVVRNFILFCHDIGRSLRMTPDELSGRIEQIDGHEHYDAARKRKRGAIVVTAHMGSFEVGMAALRRQDAKIHVVFRRDLFGRFERMRSALRAKLGVIEAPVDDGWTVWMRLRDALQGDEVVVLQGDRVMPGQKGQPVAVLGADMMLPSGPVKLALATGSPIVPVFCVRTASGKVRLCVEPAIDVNGPADVDRGMEQLAAVIGRYVRAHGDQWLMLQPAWCADAPQL
jgi:KDO2-lipid IV(A) lauroyltransferase